MYGALAVADMDSGAAQDFPLTGYAVLASWAAKYPRTAAAFTKAVEQGNAIAATNLAVLQHVLSTSLHLSPDITGVMATGTFPTSVSPAQIQRAADLMLEYGQLREPFNVKSLMRAEVAPTGIELAAGGKLRMPDGSSRRPIRVAFLTARWAEGG
jgi:NitT/TauT family transport system substrate-binding protein